MGAPLPGDVRPLASWAVAWEKRERPHPGLKAVTVERAEGGRQLAVGVVCAKKGLEARGRNLSHRLLVGLEGESAVGSSRG